MTDPTPQAPPILTTQARLALRVLSDDDVARVHEAALELLGAEGAAAEAAAQSAPSAFVLAGHVPEHDAALGAGLVWLAAGAATAGPAGVPARVRRLDGGDSVPATAADLDDAIRLADALPEIAVLAGPPLRAAGVSAVAALAHCLAGTSKHVMAGLLVSAADAEVAVEAAVAVAGSVGEARRRPPLSLCGGTASLDAALVFARAGLPVGLVLAPADAASGVAAPPSSTAATADSASPAPADTRPRPDPPPRRCARRHVRPCRPPSPARRSSTSPTPLRRACLRPARRRRSSSSPPHSSRPASGCRSSPAACAPPATSRTGRPASRTPSSP